MALRPVHWHEGMFLRPHHFQLAQRFAAYQSNQTEKFDLHYNWGLRSIELDLDALANYRLVVRSLRARLRDGTTVSIPEDGSLPEVALKSAFEQDSSFKVLLAVPLLIMGKANLGVNAATEGARFLVDTQQLEDENTGMNPQPMQVRLLNLKLLLSNQDHQGYEFLPIAQIERSARAEATPQLDTTYIPPVLGCDAWKTLSVDILQAVFDRIGKKIEQLANRVVSGGITFDSHAQGDPLILERLRAMNEAYTLLGVMAFAQGIHPLPVYTELCRLVGQLAIFDDSRRPPELPHYDHDDLGTCFYRVKQHIDKLIDVRDKQDYEERPFIGAGLRMQVSLEPSWLEPIWQMYVGVQVPAEVSAEECIRMLTKSGQLDMKIASSDRVDEVFKQGMRGLTFAHSPRPPRALPTKAGLVYFQVNRDAQQEEWQKVQKSLALAIRLNENLIAGNIQGQRILSIKASGKVTTMQFTLYVVSGDQK